MRHEVPDEVRAPVPVSDHTHTQHLVLRLARFSEQRFPARTGAIALRRPEASARTRLAGTPVTTVSAGTSRVTTAPAPIIALADRDTAHHYRAAPDRSSPAYARRHDAPVRFSLQGAATRGSRSLSFMNITPCPTKTSSRLSRLRRQRYAKTPCSALRFRAFLNLHERSDFGPVAYLDP